MATQPDFANLDQLNTLDHGDAFERFYWPVVSASLSEYEIFWRAFIVLAGRDGVCQKTRSLSDECAQCLLENEPSDLEHCGH